MTDLRFPDAQTLDDLRTLVGRAKSLDDAGAIRLQAHGTTLAAYVGVLPGTGLLGQGTVLGLRAMPLAEPAEADVTVPLGAVTDRLARMPVGADPVLGVPPSEVHPPWAALAPPRSGWERVGAVDAETVGMLAEEGIREVAQGSPPGAGAHAVAALRTRVWGRATTSTPPFPAGGAFAAYVLGFCPPGATATLFAHGRWTRLSTPAGHVLMR